VGDPGARDAGGDLVPYKIGSAREQLRRQRLVRSWPGAASNISTSAKMLGVWQVTNLNLTTIANRPHNDYGETRTGLPDGFHLVSARAFLERSSAASVYNTFKQTIYLDAETPQGYVEWPANNGDILAGSEYGVVVRTDPSVREVWYRIEDVDAANDDAAIGKATATARASNRTWMPMRRRIRCGEAFTDLDGDGIWDTNGVTSWQPAYATTPGDMNQDYPLAWRFTYANLPTGGTATIKVRLREWSSAERPAWTNGAMTTNTGHYTELTRTVAPAGPVYKLYFDWPEADGTLVEAGWTVRIKYSSTFAAGISGDDALDLFTIRLNSTENGGDPADGTVLTPEDVDLAHVWNYPYENTITFTMPNVYNGQPDWLHGFEIVGTRDGYPALRATRKVTTAVVLLPSINGDRAAGADQRRRAVRDHPRGTCRRRCSRRDPRCARRGSSWRPAPTASKRAFSSLRRRATRARCRRHQHQRGQHGLLELLVEQPDRRLLPLHAWVRDAENQPTRRRAA
jgi:hypothetical protein